MTSLVTQARDPFQRFVALSLLAHIAVFTMSAVKSCAFPSEDLIIRNAIKVDMVALPDKIVKPAPPAPKVEKAKPKVKVKVKKEVKNKTKPKIAKNKKAKEAAKKKQEDAIRKLQQKMALENLQKQQAENNSATKTKPKLNKGNIITSGSDFSGIDRLKFEEYFSHLKKHINDHWNLPEWLSQSDLKAQVQINIDERGYIIKKEMVSTSGNDVYDSSLMSALEASSPLPQPPPRLRDQLSRSAIVLRFPGG